MCIIVQILLSCGKSTQITENNESAVSSDKQDFKNIESKEDSQETVLTITRKDGKTETLTLKELKAIGKSNGAKFDKYYRGAKVSGEGYVDRISSGTYYYGNKFDLIDFVDVPFIHLCILPGSFSGLAELEKGSKISFTTNIGGTASFIDFIHSNLYNSFILKIMIENIIASLNEFRIGAPLTLAECFYGIPLLNREMYCLSVKNGHMGTNSDGSFSDETLKKTVIKTAN